MQLPGSVVDVPFESHHPSDARENAKVRRKARRRRGGAPADAAAIAFDGAIGTRPASTAFDGASRRWRMSSCVMSLPPRRRRRGVDGVYFAMSQVLERYKAMQESLPEGSDARMELHSRPVESALLAAPRPSPPGRLFRLFGCATHSARGATTGRAR